MRQPVGERRPVVEHEFVGARRSLAIDVKNVPSRSQRSRMRSSICGKFGCNSTVGITTTLDRSLARSLGSPASHGSRVPQGRPRSHTAAGTAVPPCLRPASAGRRSVCAGDDGPDPFGSTGGRGATRSSEGSEVMASSLPLTRCYPAARGQDEARFPCPIHLGAERLSR